MLRIRSYLTRPHLNWGVRQHTKGARDIMDSGVRLIPHVRRAYWHGLFRLSRRQTLAGVEVRVFLPDAAKSAEIDAKIAEAFRLLDQYGPKHLARIQRLADGVILLGTIGALGSWNRDARRIRVSQDFITASDTKPVHIAATLVHEATHAWLDQLGIKYEPARRARMESVCYRAQSAFARKVPESEHAVAEYDACAQLVLEQPDEEWSDAAFRLRTAESLASLVCLDGWQGLCPVRRACCLTNVEPDERAADCSLRSLLFDSLAG